MSTTSTVINVKSIIIETWEKTGGLVLVNRDLLAISKRSTLAIPQFTRSISEALVFSTLEDAERALAAYAGAGKLGTTGYGIWVSSMLALRTTLSEHYRA